MSHESNENADIELLSEKIRNLEAQISIEENRLAELTSKIEKEGGCLNKLPWIIPRKDSHARMTKQIVKKSSVEKAQKGKNKNKKHFKYKPPAEVWRITLDQKKSPKNN